jgi:signal transduction histidine kinase
VTPASEDSALRARLGHDLKTPLTVIIGYGALLGSRADEESRIEASRMIVEAAERLSREIDEVLDRLLPG